jgi:hypothetical protein
MLKIAAAPRRHPNNILALKEEILRIINESYQKAYLARANVAKLKMNKG